MISEDRLTIESLKKYDDFTSFIKEQKDNVFLYCCEKGINHKRYLLKLEKAFNQIEFVPFGDIAKICGRKYNLKEILAKKNIFEETFLESLVTYFADLSEKMNIFHRKIWGSNKKLFEKFRPRTPKEMEKIMIHYSPFDEVVNRMCDKLDSINAKEFGEEIPKKFKRSRRKKVEEYIYYAVCLQFLQGWIIEDLIGHYISKEMRRNFVKSLDEEDSHHIDGYIDGIPVNIKPLNYSERYDYNGEGKNISKIVYSIDDDGILIDFSGFNKKDKEI